MRKVALMSVVLGCLWAAPAANATIPDVFGGDVTCTNFDNGTLTPTDDQRRCGGGADEVQQLDIDATGGTFTLTFGADTTAPVAFDATGPALDSALEALAGIGTGNVVVSKPGSPAGRYNVTFSGALSRANVSRLRAGNAGLSGGASTATDGQTTTQGELPSTTASFDGVPLDINVAFPADPGAGDNNYPLIMVFHGYGGGKLGFDSLKRWTDRGYAVFTMTDRGFRYSCGAARAITLGGSACDDGYVRLIDTRYEPHDAQFLAGELADEELIDPQQIGATGGSYGGGLSMALAALKDRVMNLDYTLSPWTSPVDNKPMQIAAATPGIPWTDLAYSLTPNGGNLDYVADSPYTGRIGVMKLSFVSGLYISGLGSPGNYVPTGTDDTADLAGWQIRLLAGEPYDGDSAVEDILDEISQHHSSYGIDHSQAPAPLLISSGFTDDLFPVDEALRFYNRTSTEYPDSPISVFFGDFGHQRAQNKADVVSALVAREDAWMDFYVKGVGSAPPQQAEVYTETCPSGNPSGGPFAAPTWAEIAPGEVRFSSAAAKTITPAAGSDTVAAPFNPISGPGACATAAAADQVDTATYRLPAAPSAGYTMVGSPTVLADIASPGANNQLAARLLDVNTQGTASTADDTESLVARQLYRSDVGSSSQVFQLHPGAWRFASGHIAKLELLPKDSDAGFLGPYARPSDGQGPITVSNLELRLPTVEEPGSLGGLVKAPAANVLRTGQTLSAGAAALTPENAAIGGGGKLKLKSSAFKLQVGAPEGWDSAHATVKVFLGGGALASAKRLLISGGKATIAGSSTKTLKLRVGSEVRKKLGKARTVRVRVVVTTTEQSGSVQATRQLLLSKAKSGKSGKTK